MVALNQLLSERDLAGLSENEREFLIGRIDHYFGSPEVLSIVGDKLQEAVKMVNPDIQVQQEYRGHRG